MTRRSQRWEAGVERIVLPGGARLVTRRDPALPLAALRGYVRGGSMAEVPPNGGGVAHLLEHVLGGLAADTMRLHGDGALPNAFTGRDLTCYRWHALADDVAWSLRHLLDALGAELAPERLDAEKRVVREEVILACERPLATLQQRVVEELFPAHPFRNPVGGTVEGVERVTVEALEDYRRRQYGGPEVTVVAVGDLDPEALAEVAGAAPLPAGDGALHRLPVTGLGAPDGPRRVVVEAPVGDDAWTVVGYGTGGAGSPAAPALEELAARLSAPGPGGLGSLLQPIDGVRQVAVRLTETAFGAGCLAVLVRHRAGRSDPVADAVVARLGALGRGEAALPARPAAAGSAVPLATLDGWCELLGEGEVRGGDPLRALTVERARSGLGDADLRDVAASHLAPERAVVGRLAPPAARRRRRRAPARTSRGRVLDNGLTLLVVPTPSPLAACQVLFRGGVLGEDAATQGVCSLMARTLPEDPPPPLRKRLDAYRRAHGTDLFAFCDSSFYGLSVTAPAAEVAAGAALLAELVFRPALSEVAVRREAERTAVWLEGRVPRWDEEVQAGLRRLLYRRHPYRLDEIGTPAILRRVGLAEVEARRRATWGGGNGAVVVTGRVDPAETLDRLEAAFAGAPAGDAVDPPAPEPRAGGPRRRRVEHERAHAALGLGFAGVPWGPDQPALEMLKSLLVGPRNDAVTGRLLRAVRRLGAAYSLRLVEQAGPGEGYVAVVAACATGSETAVEERVVEELERLRRGEVDEPEVAACRKLALLDHLLLYEDPRLQAYSAGRCALLAGRVEAWDERPGELARVRPEDVVRVARAALVPARMAATVATPRGARAAMPAAHAGQEVRHDA